MAARGKPMPGHKLASTSIGVSVRCECGWRSETVYGRGARQDALKQWRNHQDHSTPACKAA